jgi:hypothetical protein
MTLLLGAKALEHETATRWLAAAFWLAVAGLMLTAISNEIWPLELLMQGQPWRWTWLGRFLAIATLPILLLNLWKSGKAGRGSALLLASAWLAVVPVSARSPITLMLDSELAAIALLVWLARARLSDAAQQLILRCAIAVLGIVIASSLITASLSSMMIDANLDIPPEIQRVANALNRITPGVLIVVLVWAAMTLGNRVVIVSGLVLAGIACALALPYSLERWTRRTYTGDSYEQFASWREIIPLDTEVFWWDSLRETWFLLNRRSYLTVSQGGGLVFSEDLLRESRRRALAAGAFIDPGYWFRESDPRETKPVPLTSSVLASVCRDPILGFVVSTTALSQDLPRQEWPNAGTFVYLYDCNDYRDGAGA